MVENKSPLEVKIKSGTFYISSNEEKEGWKKVDVTNPQTGEKLVRYHKELTIDGNLLWIGMRDAKFRGRLACFLIKGHDGETYSLNTPILSTKGIKSTDSYFNSLALVSPKLKKGDAVKMFVNSRNKDKKDQLYKNVVVLNGQDQLIKSDIDFKDIPKWGVSKTKDAFGEETTEYDPKEANAFYIQEFMKSVNYFKDLKENKTEQQEQPKSSNNHVEHEDDNDDLPF